MNSSALLLSALFVSILGGLAFTAISHFLNIAIIGMMVFPCLFLLYHLIKQVIELEQKVNKLESSLRKLSNHFIRLKPREELRPKKEADYTKPAVAIVEEKPVMEPEPESLVESTPSPIEVALADDQAEGVIKEEYLTRPQRPPREKRDPNVIQRFFTEGNLIVRVGAILLFFGFAFLIKYANDHAFFSIETRLAFAFIFAFCLTVLGWRLRDKEHGYGQVLQGTGIGIIYLTCFAAFRVYHVLPQHIVFPALVLLSALAITMAAAQSSCVLAVLSSIGGFLAPVLTSTGAGSHVALFSYYAILNCGIFAVAWVRSWRILNLIGFTFTFVIGTIWGVLKYKSYQFASTEPFLILFFLMYLTIACLFTLKQKKYQRGFIDGTLVFVLPLITFSLQAAMVHIFEYGLAWSALGLGLIYLSLGLLFIFYQIKALAFVAEAFLALGILFLTLAVPLAFDNQWTSALFTVEGAALIWIGLRQQRLFCLGFGGMIQIVGGMVFLSTLNFNVTFITPFAFDSRFLGILLAAIASLISSYLFYRYQHKRSLPLNPFEILFFIWGLLWWYGGSAYEVNHHVKDLFHPHVYLCVISGSLLLSYLIKRGLTWPTLKHILFITLGLLITTSIQFIYLYRYLFINNAQYFWGTAILVLYLIYYLSDREVDNKEKYHKDNEALSMAHTLSLIWLVGLSMVETFHLINVLAFSHKTAGVALFGVLANLWLWGLYGYRFWPVNKHRDTYQTFGLPFVALGFLLWNIFYNFPASGVLPNWPYIPFINPLDILQMLGLFIIYRLTKTLVVNQSAIDLIKYAAFSLGFVWLNVVIFRVVHITTEIPYTLDDMMHSSLVQTALSIFWTLTGLSLTIYGSQKRLRQIWMVGGCFIAVVVFKLFLIDLANSSSLERIISFIVVGILLLSLGYYSPLPSSNKED